MMAPLVLPSAPLAGAASHAPVRVPDVRGLTKAQVYSSMRRAGLYFTTRGPGSANGAWRQVVAEDPRAGTLVAWHSTVSFTTTTHAGHAPRRVPDVLGKTRAQVYAAMRTAQLYFSTVGPGSSNGSWVRVVGEDPRAGTVVAWHASVTFTTSLHAPARHASVRVPSFSHLGPAQVSRTSRAAGLRVRLRGPGSTNRTWRQVVGQSVRAGTRVRWHSVIVLTTSRSSPVTLTARHPTTTTTARRSPTTTTVVTGAPTTSTVAGTGDTTTVAPTTTTTERPATTTTLKKRATKPRVRYRIGVATWYSYIPGHCATSYLPFGTRLTVRDLSNGHVVHCIVTDREGRGAGRVVDLSRTEFVQLAALWRGVVRVKVSW
jgi:beta-lactam-binding protein with PASTA domain